MNVNANVLKQRIDVPRARGRVELGFEKGGLRHLFQQGCARILLPRVYVGRPQGIVINTAGGLTGDDRFETRIELGAGASLCMSSQTAERIYKSSAGRAQVKNRIVLKEGSALNWFPQETILFDGSAFERHLDVEMAIDARLLASEMLVFGRTSMGEKLTKAFCHDSWRVRRGGKLIYGDALRFSQPDQVGRLPVCFDGALAVANVLYVAEDAEHRLSEARKLIGRANVSGAASAWNGILSVRLAGQSAQDLRNDLVSFLTGFSGAEMPRVWQM